jgi:hypothetical protein
MKPPGEPVASEQPRAPPAAQASTRPATSFVDCLLATICAYFCWSGLLQQVSADITILLDKFIDLAQYCAGDSDEQLFFSAMVSAAAHVKSGLERTRHVEFIEADHDVLYEHSLGVIKKIRARGRL